MLKSINKFYPIRYLTLLIIVIFALTGALCQKTETTPETTTEEETTTTTTTTDLTTIDPTTISTTFLTNYNTAKEKAILWKGDAKLVTLTVKLPQDLSLNKATETFVFGSDSDPDYWWTFSISESSGKYVRALIPKEDYLGTATTAIAEKYWKTNYLQAFQKADSYTGKSFRTSNSEVEVIVTLSHGDPKGWLWWLVEYKSADGNSTKVRINPGDLTIVDDLGNTISSGTSSSSETTTTTSQ